MIEIRKVIRLIIIITRKDDKTKDNLPMKKICFDLRTNSEFQILILFRVEKYSGNNKFSLTFPIFDKLKQNC